MTAKNIQKEVVRTKDGYFRGLVNVIVSRRDNRSYKLQAKATRTTEEDARIDAELLELDVLLQNGLIY